MSFINVFNIKATPDPELRRVLDYLTRTGDGYVLSAFTRAAEAEAEAKAEWTDQIAMMMIQMATEEQVRQFHERLDDLEVRRIRLLERIDEELRQARQERQRLYDEAMEFVFPDGTVHKVFRDGDQVRDGNGDLVGPDIASAEDVSNDPNQWSEYSAVDALVERHSDQRESVTALDDTMQEARAQADAGEYSADELESKATEFENLLAEQEQLLDAASPGAGVDRPFDENFTLPSPSPSAPAPR